MTMHERGGPGGETFEQTVMYEVYLRGREDPVHFNATFEMRKELIEEGSELESVMQFAINNLLGTIDVVREHRWILSDERHNKFVMLTDQIQAVSILAPTREAIKEGLEG